MFCAKCGKKIDDDSTFCPYCGQKVDAPVEKGKLSRGVSEKPGGLKNKLPLVGIAVAVVAVAAVVFSAVKIIGGSKFGKTPIEKIFAMSWEESSETTTADIKAMLDEEGILYKSDNSDYYGESLWTGMTDTFMGNDCLFGYIDRGMDWDRDTGWESDNTLHTSVYGIAYETTDAFKEGRKELEEYLSSKVIKNSKILSDENNALYVVEESDKNIQAFIEKRLLLEKQWEDAVPVEPAAYAVTEEDEIPATVADTEEDEEELPEVEDAELEDCHVFKFVQVCYTSPDDYEYFNVGDFTGDKSYIDYMCEICVSYTLMSQEDYISFMAEYGYDAVKGKEIDLEGFRKSVDDAFIEALDIDDEWYSALYMIEKNNFDILSSSYLKSDDEKWLWYINNFEWDINTKAPVDLSGYKNSAKIYCAAEYNYNSDTKEYFGSDIDKALYLADRDYKADTGESFGGTDDKRLYFMQNYSYDISAGKVIDKETVDALIAYQKYIDQCIEQNEDTWSWYSLYGNLLYLNDDTPDLILVGDPHSSGRTPMEHTIYLASYTGGQLVDKRLDLRLGDETIQYTPKSGLICGGGWQGTYDYDGNGELEASVTSYKIIQLEDTFEEIGSADSTEIYEWMSGDFLRGEYSVNGAAVSSKEEVDEYLDSFGFTEMSIYYNWQQLVSYEGNKTATLLNLYDSLRTTEYLIYAYAFTEFNLSEGILTFSSDYGSRYDDSWEPTEEPFPYSYSYPVAEDCRWERYNVGEDVPYEITDYERMKEMVDGEMESYRKQFEEYGDIDWDSPQAYYIKVTDDKVVNVYTVSP